MPKQKVSKVDALLSGLLTRLEKIETMTVEQFPEICREIVEGRKVELYGLVLMHSLGFVIAVGAMFGTLCVGWGSGSGTKLICCLVAFPAVILTIYNSEQAMSSIMYLRVLKVAPKLYVIEKLKSMVG